MSNDELLEEIRTLKLWVKDLEEIWVSRKLLARQLEYGINKEMTIEQFHNDILQVVKDTKRMIDKHKKRASNLSKKLALNRLMEKHDGMVSSDDDSGS